MADIQLVQAVSELESDGTLSGAALARAVGAFLRRKRLTKRVGKMLRALDTYQEMVSGQIAVIATSAHALSVTERQSVEERATQLLGKSGQVAMIKYQVDRAAIGGLRLETSDRRYDSTVSRALQELRKSL